MNCIWILKLYPVILFIWINKSISILTFSNSLNHVQISFWQSNLLVVQFISNFFPPFRILLSSQKLFNFIICLHSSHFFSLDCISHMIIILIPMLRYFPCSNQDLLIWRIIWPLLFFILREWNLILILFIIINLLLFFLEFIVLFINVLNVKTILWLSVFVIVLAFWHFWRFGVSPLSFLLRSDLFWNRTSCCLLSSSLH